MRFASLNVTYNYATHYRRVFEVLEGTREKAPEWMRTGRDAGEKVLEIRTIYGLTGAESIAVPDKAIEQLGDEVDPDYWQPTEGNAKRALLQLRALATMRPDGLWDGD